ncbi:MAG: T9SS type A sorting domain-containing protein [Bacteroidales bacterium]|nr:T9SS type A sorting domain-containing protein [Bacteroidales bacterium]
MFYSLAMTGQIYPPSYPPNVPLYSSDYLIPQCIDSLCPNLSNHMGFSPAAFFDIIKVAQPYYVSVPISIKGIAGLISSKHFTGTNPNEDGYCDCPDSIYEKAYLQIHQPLGNIIASLRYDTITTSNNLLLGGVTPAYIELMLDSAIYITDTFFVVVTMMPSVSIYMDNETLNFKCGAGGVVSSRKRNNPKECCEPLAPYIQSITGSSYGWQSLCNAVFYQQPAPYLLDICNDSCNPAFYLFPIIDSIVSCNASVESFDSVEKQTITINLTIHNEGFPAPKTVGIIYDTALELLTLSNQHIITSNYNSNTNIYQFVLPYDSLICNAYYYYKPFFITEFNTMSGSYDNFIRTCNDLRDISNEIISTIFPNPTDKKITITTSIPMQKVEIVNSIGQSIYEQELKDKSITINTSKFISGNYIAIIITSKGFIKKQFVVK